MTMTRVCLITGGSRGIGRETARLAAASGWDVAVNYRERSEAADVAVAAAHALGRRAMAVRGDVADEADVIDMFRAAERQLGPITGLVNSAGVSFASRVDALKTADIQRMLAVNVTGLMLCCREAAKRMSTANGGKGGAIVNVSSMAATIGGRPGASTYAASKGAVDVFTLGGGGRYPCECRAPRHHRYGDDRGGPRRFPACRNRGQHSDAALRNAH